ncbi:MAG: DbpA RNA binding domain-containing protein, partial [Prevotella sp.]|nr:DbpA RNA binding domain-containing protein [Prevotella sp.]
DYVPEKVNIGRIDILQNFSFFEVPEKDAQKVIKSISRQEQNGRRISVEVAGGGERQGGSRDRAGFGSSRPDRDKGAKRNSDFKPSRSSSKPADKGQRKGGRKPKYS